MEEQKQVAGKTYEQTIVNRLSRANGQLGGIVKMVEEERRCEDILVQLSSINSAITTIARLVLEHHIEHCVVEGIKGGDEEQTLKSLKTALAQFAKLK